MGKKTHSVLFCATLALLSVFVIVGAASANSGYRSTYNTTYKTNVSCTFCHTSPPTLNPTGAALKASGFNFAVIAPVPKVTAFTLPATSTSTTVGITAFTATDNIPITGYVVTESAAAPTATAAGWSATPQTSYTFATTGAKTLYAFVKDAADVVSAGVSASVNISTSPPPPTADTTPPSITAFTVPATSSSLTVSITAFTATDNVGVTGYLIDESTAVPLASDPGWKASAPTSYTVAAEGAHALCAWAIDAAGNISNYKSQSVTVTLPAAADTVAPTIVTFSVPPTSGSLTIPINSLVATDNVGVTAYLVNESPTKPGAANPNWSSALPNSFTAAKAGAITLYAWAKDAAGNISSSMSANVTITLPGAAAPDMTVWVGTWLKVKVVGQDQGAMNANTLEVSRQTTDAYLNITGWDPATQILDSALYEYDTTLAQWVSDPWPLHVVSGGPLNFRVWTQVVGADVTYGLAASLKGRLKGGALTSATFRTLGGYYAEIQTTNSSGATANGNAGNAAGWLRIRGSLLPEGKLPATLVVP